MVHASLVARVLVFAHAILHIKWRRLPLTEPMYLSLNKLASKYGKIIVIVFIYIVQSSKKVKVIIFPFIPSRFSFASNTTNFFKQVCFGKKKNYLSGDGFLQLHALYSNIPLKCL